MSSTTTGDGTGVVQIQLRNDLAIFDFEATESAVRNEVTATERKDPQYPVLRGIDAGAVNVSYEGWLTVAVKQKASEDPLGFGERLKRIETCLVEIAFEASNDNVIVVQTNGDPSAIKRKLERHEQLSVREVPFGSGQLVVFMKIESLKDDLEKFEFAREVLTRHVDEIVSGHHETAQQGEATVLRS